MASVLKDEKQDLPKFLLLANMLQTYMAKMVNASFA